MIIWERIRRTADGIRRRLGRARAPVTAQRGDLSGLYPDDVVAGMGSDDGSTGVQPKDGKPGSLPGEQVVWKAAITTALAVCHHVAGAAGAIRQAHARRWQAFQDARARAREALAAAIRNRAELAALLKKLADLGLGRPAPRWRITTVLAILGLGDLTVTQTALLVLDISDKPFASWLPVSQLTVAAVPLVVGMLVAAHFLGEAIKARRYERAGLRQVIIAVVSLAGGVLLAVSVADIRIAYMAALGVATIAWPFVCLQLGLFCVAVAASTWAAHPFHAEFKAASRGVKTAEGKARRARRRAHDRAGAVNRLAERHLTLVDEAAATARGTLTTGQRQVCIYRRSYLLASAGASRPAPASLFTGAPEEKLSPELTELLQPENRRKKDSVLAPLERASLDDLDHDARAYLQDQMQHEADINQETADRGQHAPAALSSAAYTLNGKSPDGSAPGNAQAGAAGNGSAQAGA